ncbi:PolC-type DNA polymerase III [Lacticaseibacillus baoqingensis]|uniref:PolC-type DNA polymerase III n=1 Tax=Lacticaseibacillus baoqingensis TaxID=2486013 RepID=A0ABW4E3E7_9LACO|nr:3'-5' exonuclease [Lacticaseibacillus baoqingensis]
MDDLKEALQTLFTPEWQPQLLTALKTLARVGGGDPAAIGLTGLTLDLRGLWPQTLTIADQVLVSETLWPRITATATLASQPPVAKPVDWLVRKLLRQYTTALRDPEQLPQAIFPQWAAVRALYNHLQAYAAINHQQHLDAEQAPVTLTLFGPVAAETKALLAQTPVVWHPQTMTPPWQRAFSAQTHMEDLEIAAAKPRMGHAEAGLQNDVLVRARGLKKRHWHQTAAPAFSVQPPQLRQLSGRPAAYTVFDLEFSSGNQQEGQFATEIGAVKVRAGEIVDVFDAFVQIPHGKRLNRRSQALTGIHTGLLMRYGRPPATALTEFQNFIGQDPLLGFAVKGGDLLVMQRQFGLYATPGRILDVADLAKASGPMPGLPDVGLAKYRRYLGLDILAHGAIYDAVTTYALYAYLQGQPLLPEELMTKFNQVFAATSFK